MAADRIVPDDPLGFIQTCIAQGQIFWTYHVNMRMKGRLVSREVILDAACAYEIIEAYPEDKYLPSYLIYFLHEDKVYHVLFAADVHGENVRVVTAYRPDPREWSADMKARRTP